MRYGSVCSGIEAATQAWHPLGWTPAFFSDIEKFPVAVLQHHYPDVPCHGDFTTIKDDEYGAIDLLVGGTPCQSFSVAGLRGGMDDDRGNLALEFIKLAQRKRPQWLVWENVPGVLSSNGGRDFGSFLGALAEIGYGFAYRVLDAQYFGVAQRRRRVFVVGYLGDWRRAAAVLFERESLSGNPAPSREEGKKATSATEAGAGERGAISYGIRAANTGSNGWGIQEELTHTLDTSAPHAVAHPCNEVAATLTRGFGDRGVDSDQVANGNCAIVGPLTAGMGKGPRGTEAVESNHIVPVAFPMKANACDAAAAGVNVSPTLKTDPMAVASNLNVRRLTPTECERLQGFPDGFTQIPWRGKEPENCPDGPRYKALGNSMAVPVMKWIGERIQAVEDL